MVTTVNKYGLMAMKKFLKFLKKHLTNPGKYDIIITESEGHEMKKSNKKDRKMTEEQLQALLHMRTRGYVQKNGKAYNRKQKHKNREER